MDGRGRRDERKFMQEWMNSDLVHVQRSHRVLSAQWEQQNEKKRKTWWKTEKSMSIHNPWGCCEWPNGRMVATDPDDSYAKHIHVKEWVTCERSKSLLSFIFPSVHHSTRAKSIHWHAMQCFQFGATARQKSFLRRKLKMVHAALSVIDRGTYERNRCHAYTHRQRHSRWLCVGWLLSADTSIILACVRSLYGIRLARFIFRCPPIERMQSAHTKKRQTSTFNNRTNTSTLTAPKSKTTTTTWRQLKNRYVNVEETFFNSRAIKFHSYSIFRLASRERITKIVIIHLQKLWGFVMRVRVCVGRVRVQWRGKLMRAQQKLKIRDTWIVKFNW